MGMKFGLYSRQMSLKKHALSLGSTEYIKKSKNFNKKQRKDNTQPLNCVHLLLLKTAEYLMSEHYFPSL